jgi:hypothetical protein
MSPHCGSHRVVLHVPGLSTRIIGAGCCLMPLRNVASDELRSWPGVHVVEIDDTTERIVAEIGPHAGPTPEDLLEAVRDLGATDTSVIAADQAGDRDP